MDAVCRAVVIGLGNEFRGDDACGLRVARYIKERSHPGVEVVEGVSDGTAMIDAWDGVEFAIVVDSIRSGAPAGKILRFEPIREPLTENLSRSSTHRISITRIIELAEALGRLPGRLVVYCIEGTQFGYGAAMTPAVAKSVNLLQNQIEEELLGLSDPGAGS